MPLDVPDGERCLLDANILYYSYVETPPLSEACRHLLQHGDITALTDCRALSDCLHKTMLAEISQKFGRSRDRLIGWIKQHPEALENLPKTIEVGSRLAKLHMTILPNDAATLPTVIRMSDAPAAVRRCPDCCADARARNRSSGH